MSEGTEDNADSETRNGLTSRQVRALVFVGVLLGAVVIPATVVALAPSNSGPVSGPVSLSAPDGPTVTVRGSTSADLSEPFPSGDTVELTTADGNMSLSGADSVTASVEAGEITGEWTNLTGLSVSNALVVNPEDKQRVTVTGDDTSSLAITDMVVNDGSPDFAYSGTGGLTKLRVTDLPPDARLQVVDSTGTQLDTATTDASGSVWFVLPNSQHTVSLQSQDLDDIAPYYDDETADVNESEWFDGNENATAPAIVDMLGRLGPYVIGTGDTIPGGSTYAGTIVLGLVVAAVFLSAVMGTGMGAPGGSVAALTVGYGLARAGLAPPWIRVVMLFLLGLTAAVVVKRLTR